jgi:transaldolase
MLIVFLRLAFSIAPKLLQELMDSTEDVPKKLESETASRDKMEKVSFVDDEQKFLDDLKNDQMAYDKLHEGIAGFDKDGKTLKDTLKEKLSL